MFVFQRIERALALEMGEAAEDMEALHMTSYHPSPPPTTTTTARSLPPSTAPPPRATSTAQTGAALSLSFSLE